MADSIIIYWDGKDSIKDFPDTEGEIDFFPKELFQEEQKDELCAHPFLLKSDPKVTYLADFILNVADSVAEIDYSHEKVKIINEEKDYLLGKLEISFKDSSRSEVEKVKWYMDDKEYDLKYNVDFGGLATSKVIIRYGQSVFKKGLIDIFGCKCMVSGIEVKAVIDAAHIVPFSTATAHKPNNGLLLRSDIHKLFDRHLIGIDPKTYKVKVSEQLMNVREYAQYHDKNLLVSDKKLNVISEENLEVPWRKFQNK